MWWKENEQMAKKWDGTLKWLVGEAPQDFVDWLGQGSLFVSELSPHLDARNIDADLLYRALYEDQPYLLHIEFQKRSITNMPSRMCEYNMLAARKHGLPVYSVVIYLKKDRPIVESPYVYTLPWGEESIRFNYRSIKLWEIPTEAILRSGHEGLLPLVPLTRDGLRRESIEQVIAALSPVGSPPKVDALSLTYTLAMLESTKVDDLAWLRRSFAMFNDILDDMIKDSWVYKEWTQEATEQGIKQGMQQGMQQGGQQMLVSMVQTRFAPLAELAKERSALMKTPEALQLLFTQLLLAKDEKEAMRLLLEIQED